MNNSKNNSNNDTKRTTFKDVIEENDNNQPKINKKLNVDSDWKDVKKSIAK